MDKVEFLHPFQGFGRTRKAEGLALVTVIAVLAGGRAKLFFGQGRMIAAFRQSRAD